MDSTGDQKVKSHTVSYSHLYFIRNYSIFVLSMSRFLIFCSLFFVENVRCSQQRIKKEIEVFVTNSELPYQLKLGLHGPFSAPRTIFDVHRTVRVALNKGNLSKRKHESKIIISEWKWKITTPLRYRTSLLDRRNTSLRSSRRYDRWWRSVSKSRTGGVSYVTRKNL